MPSKNKSITVYALDDEPIAVSIIEKFVQKTAGLKLVGSSTDPVMALSEIEQLMPQLLFLDINMPEISGFDLLKILGDKKPLVIITSAYPEYAIRGYEFEVINYLLKPIPYDEFTKATDKARERLRLIDQAAVKTPPTNEEGSPEEGFFIKVNKENVRVKPSEIAFIESFGDYVKVHFTGRSKNFLVARSTLSSIEKELPRSRIHPCAQVFDSQYFANRLYKQ